MAYRVKEITIRANNSPEGMARIAELWRDLAGGKLPLLFDSEHRFIQGISPVSRYSHYADGQDGDYDLSVLAVTAEFFGAMEKQLAGGAYKKYDVAGKDVQSAAAAAWQKVWADQKAGTIRRAFTSDYESAVPAEYTKDGTAHCYLYIAVMP